MVAILGAMVLIAIAVTVAAYQGNRGVAIPITPTAPAGQGLVIEPSGPFATAVSTLTENPRSADWVTRLWSHGTTGRPGEWLTQFGLSSGSNAGSDYSIPVYDARTATVKRRVRQKISYGGVFNIAKDELVPWNDNWRPADGNDGFLVVINPDTGEEWDYWNVSGPGFSAPNNTPLGCVNATNLPPPLGLGFDVNSDICAAAVVKVLSPTGSVVDIRGFSGNMPPASGGGLPNSTGLVMPSEVSAGVIKHAWKFMARNTMFGPECSPAALSDPAQFGETCGSAIAPAGQFEKVGNTDGVIAAGNQAIPGNTPDEQRANTVPEGLRFSIRLTDEEIAAWLDSRGYVGAKRETARIMAVSLRDYGWFITDTSGAAAFFQVAGGANSADAARWRALGVDGDGVDLLQGLFTKDRLVTWEPATNTCSDGTTSRWYCWATASGYDK